jgi:hypothetical protein
VLQRFPYIAQYGRIVQTKKRIAFRIAVSDNESAHHIANQRPKSRFIGSRILGRKNINGREKAWYF